MITSAEMQERDAWFDAAFRGVTAAAADNEPYLVLIANQWGPAKQNQSLQGGRLNIAGTEYRRGLACHALSRIAVRLPGPAAKFEAVVGVDSNKEWTIPGRGNVEFVVHVAGEPLFRSPVMHEGNAGMPVNVALQGAREFLLEVADGGRGIDYGQGDWCDARVTLEDGREFWLGDLTLLPDPRKGPHVAAWPFSFTYAGKSSRELLPTWRMDAPLTWTDPVTGLQVRCVVRRYDDFPTVEWTIYFKNTGDKNTPIIENIRALDTKLEREPGTEFLLHHAVGSPSTPGDYGPRETWLGKTATKRITTSGGRGSNSDWPYFNLEAGKEGTIIAVGWPGQWAADFVRDETNGIRLAAGQETTHFSLHPGEEVRTPLIVLQFWKGGDWIRAQNIWRRWMIAHNISKPLPAPMTLGCSSRLFAEMVNANEQNQIDCVALYQKHQLPIDYWWMDAGWYPCKGAWPNTGTWEVDQTRFPRGFKPVREKAGKIVVWFEPERVTPDSWLAKNHPDWLLGGTLLNLGHPDAWHWLVNHIDRLITENGVDIYRQDFNIDPLPFWQKNDAPNRQGITEIKHITGYLAYWDELRRRHPGLLIDACASGGRRNDLESMRRAVPLWRTDCPYDPVATQSQTYGISFWLPYHGTGTVACGNVPYLGAGWTPVEPYAFWSNVTPSTVFGMDVRENLDFAALRRLIAQRAEVVRHCYGDYYPLTPYTLENYLWMGWQFHDGDIGAIQMFRRAGSPFEAARIKLFGLDPQARYEVRDLDKDAVTLTGKELLETGLPIEIAAAPGYAVFTYKRLD